jgi:hypothetical protein
MASYAVFFIAADKIPAQGEAVSHIWAYRSTDVPDAATAVREAAADHGVSREFVVWAGPVGGLTRYSVTPPAETGWSNNPADYVAVAT